jgi:hypothetical protein
MRARQSGIGDSVGPAFHLSLFTFHQVLENGGSYDFLQRGSCERGFG